MIFLKETNPNKIIRSNKKTNTMTTQRRQPLLRRILRNKKSVTGMIVFLVGYMLTFFAFAYGNTLENLNSEVILRFAIKAIPVIIIIIGIGYFLLGYLEGNKFIETKDESRNYNFLNTEEIRNEFRMHFEELRHSQERNRYESQELLEKLKAQFEEQKELHLDEKQRLDLSETLKQSFAENINSDFFKVLNENISIELTKEKRGRLELLLRDFNSIKVRLNSEIDKLSRKANVNLVIGSLTTIVALLALGVIVFQNTGSFVSLTDMLYHYIPRLSLIIFVEVFAYFFLRLYKLNLSDMKYFQNELTTVELKLASLTTAINFGKDVDISAITIELSKTERNFIVKKGETTVESVKSKFDKTDLNEILKSITEIAKVQK